jgi:hypothetical protein
VKYLSLSVVLLIGLLSVSFNVKAQLKLYGGKNHDQFLGDITYNENDELNDELNSVWSVFSNYGGTHNPKSIWNEAGIYGSKTSDYSPFNATAKYPPQIRDEKGKFYGYLTINKNNPNRSKNTIALEICEHRDRIVKEGPQNYGKWLRPIHCGGNLRRRSVIVP